MRAVGLIIAIDGRRGAEHNRTKLDLEEGEGGEGGVGDCVQYVLDVGVV